MRLQEDVALAIRANAAVIATLSAQIEILEKRLQEKVTAQAEYWDCATQGRQACSPRACDCRFSCRRWSKRRAYLARDA
ncbi:hypothetical protein AB3X96_40835, partial [Paraburkholderia sp. BR13439]